MRIESRVTPCKGPFWVPSPDDDLQFVREEPMFFQADLDFAHEHGGPITKHFIERAREVEPNGVDPFFDSRVHMLMPGWWPCIPGWHHDDVERSREDGQPNYVSPSYIPYFTMGIVGSAECATEFAVGDIELPDVPLGDVIYRVWHPIVQEAVESGSLAVVSVQPNALYFFDDRSLHQGVQCTRGGWRWFGRITYGNPTVEPANSIRKNANVYMTAPMEGW